MSALHTVAHAATDLLSALPDPDADAPPGSDKFEKLIGWAKWISLTVCILGLFAAGALMAIQSRRGEGGEHVGKIGMVLGGVIVISVATALVSTLAG
jgi:hypothetical protein